MKPALVLKEMKELKEAWRKQGLTFTKDQQTRYDELLQLRRKRVKSFYANDRVWKGPKKTVEKKEKEEET